MGRIDTELTEIEDEWEENLGEKRSMTTRTLIDGNSVKRLVRHIAGPRGNELGQRASLRL